MATLHKAPEGGEILLVKGAPEAILDHCDRQQDASGQKPLDRACFREGLGRSRFARRARAGFGVAARSRRQGWKPRPGRSAEEPRSARPRRPSRSAAQGSDRGGEGMPRRRHPRDDDHRRPQDHRRGDRENARHRRRQDRGHRRRGRGNGHGDASGDGRQGRRVRARKPRAQAASREGHSGQRASGGDDRRRRQRRAGLEEGRHRRRHGNQGHRGHQGSGRNGAGRRQFRLDHGGGEGGAHRLQQHREGDPVHAADQRRAGFGHSGRDLRRLHDADHRAPDPVGQHGDLGRARPRDLVRAARDRT